MKRTALVFICTCILLFGGCIKQTKVFDRNITDILSIENLFDVPFKVGNAGSVDSYGLYLLDDLNRQIVYIDWAGKEIRRYGNPDNPIDGDLGNIFSLGSTDNYLFIGHFPPGNRFFRISRFSKNGNLIDYFDLKRGAARRIFASEEKEEIIIACETKEFLVQKYNFKGKLLAEFCKNPKYCLAPSGGIVDLAFVDNNYYVAPLLPYKIKIFNSEYKEISNIDGMKYLKCSPLSGMERIGCYVARIHTTKDILVVTQVELSEDKPAKAYHDIFSTRGKPIALGVDFNAFPFCADDSAVYFYSNNSGKAKIMKASR